jgi:hypothetical protein
VTISVEVNKNKFPLACGSKCLNACRSDFLGIIQLPDDIKIIQQLTENVNICDLKGTYLLVAERQDSVIVYIDPSEAHTSLPLNREVLRKNKKSTAI